MSGLKILLWPFRKFKPWATLPADPVAATGDVEKTIHYYDANVPTAHVDSDGVRVIYCTPNYATKWRVDTLFTKEPDTLQWIAGFERGDVFIDIGANVGMYSIWAAATRGTRVYAFEPESQNFALLNRNIVANGLGDRVTAYCAALSDQPGYSLLHLSDFGPGGSGHTYGEDLDHRLRRRSSPYLQGCMSTTLDRLVADGVVPVPTHIKIDVDGLEHKVLVGCHATLRDPQLKTVLIEINSTLEEHRRLVEELTALGFAYSNDQVLAARRTDGPAAGTGNYVFRR